MDARLQRRVQRYGWDKAAASYERYWAEQLAPAQQRLIEMAALGAGERVLDLACGTGLVTFPAATAVGASGSDSGSFGWRTLSTARSFLRSTANTSAVSLISDGSPWFKNTSMEFGLG